MNFYRGIVAFLIISIMIPLYSLDVAGPEIQSGGDTAAFINYEGPETVIDSAQDIKNLGQSMALSLAQSGNLTGYSGAYSVRRITDASAKSGYDADIITLSASARVDHIRNLRWIIAAYLSQSWGYSDKDAATLAVFVTVYNAVHHGDIQYFESKYKPKVLAGIDRARVGLALRFDEWPGNTQIVIPLSNQKSAGNLSSVSTTAITDPKVIQSLRDQPDMGIPERQAMVDLKTKEVEQLSAQAKSQAQAQAQTPSPGAQGQAASGASAAASAEASTAQTSEAQAKDGQSGQAASTGTAEAAQGSSADAASKAGTTASTATSEGKQKTADPQSGETASTQKVVEDKKSEIAAERASIAEDQTTLIADQVGKAAEKPTSLIYLTRIISSSGILGQILHVDVSTGKISRQTRFNSILFSSLLESESNFAAIVGEEGREGGVRIVLISKPNLDVTAQSDIDVYSRSALLGYNNSFYCIAKTQDRKWRLMRFDSDLVRQNESDIEVMPSTVIRAADTGIVVQTNSKNFAILDPQTLAKKASIAPKDN